MRDQAILERFEMLADMMAQDIAQIQRGISMLRTRQDTIERLLFKSRFGIVKVVLVQMFSPSLLERTINRLHSEEISRYNEQRRLARERTKVKPAPTPGLITIH